MTKVRTFSTSFPSYHSRKGEPTYFVEKIWKGLYDEPDDALFSHEVSTMWSVYKEIHSEISPKCHTVRAGHHFKVGDWFSPRVWSGMPYRSKQIIIAPDIQVKKEWGLLIDKSGNYILNGEKELSLSDLKIVAKNDGFENSDDFELWFSNVKSFDGQIICWNESIEYL